MTDQVALAKVTKYFDSEVVRARFREVLGSRDAGAYISSVLLAVAGSNSLQECSLQSIYMSALRAASLRLSVDPSTGQAYLVPFKGDATLIVGYKGLQDMAVRTGKYRYINVGPVYEGEVIEEDRISGFHRFTGQRKSKKIIGWIAAFELYSGYGKTMYMTVDEVHDHAKKYSKAYNNQSSPWKSDPDKMERKTVLRLLLRRWGYLDPIDAATLDEVETASNGEVIEGTVIEPSDVQEMDAPKKERTKPAPAPKVEETKPTLTVDEARGMKNVYGYELGTLNADQLNVIITKTPEAVPLHQAALVCLAALKAEEVTQPQLIDG